MTSKRHVGIFLCKNQIFWNQKHFVFKLFHGLTWVILLLLISQIWCMYFPPFVSWYLCKKTFWDYIGNNSTMDICALKTVLFYFNFSTNITLNDCHKKNIFFLFKRNICFSRQFYVKVTLSSIFVYFSIFNNVKLASTNKDNLLLDIYWLWYGTHCTKSIVHIK